MKKCIIKIIIIFIAVLIIATNNVNVKIVASSDEEELIICNANINDNFDDSKILITLKNSVSLQMKEYTINDFLEINCISVEDLTINTLDIVRQQLDAEKTGDWSLLTERIENDMLIDVNKFHQILCLKIGNPGKQNVLNAIKILEERNDIISAEPNYHKEISASSDDMYNVESDIWGLYGQYGINASKVWNLTADVFSVKVGILDSGIDGQHTDLENVLSDGYHYDCVNTSTSGAPTVINKIDLQDPIGHGTQIAGIIGAQGNNNLGVIGVSQNVELISIRIFNDSGITSNEILVKAIQCASLLEIKVLNLSGGGIPYDLTLHKCIDGYPGLFVCAAGNLGQNNDLIDLYPPNYDCSNLICVGAINSNGYKAGFSNYGRTIVDIFAPGENIYSTCPKSKDPTGYIRDGGTSLAAPFVTGVAALMLSINPNLEPEQLKYTIMNNVTKISTLSDLCVSGGILDAFKAVSAVAYNTSTVENNIKIEGFVGTHRMIENANIEIPSSFAQVSSEYGTLVQNVCIIGEHSFSYQTNLKSLIIPNTVTTINYNAFENCSSLETIELPLDLETIGSSAFKGCSSLRDIEIPEGVIEISSNAFENCSSLETIELPLDLETIGSSAFDGCINIANLTIPSGAINICHNIIESINNEINLTISGNYNSIGYNSFKDCTNISTLIISNSIENIENSAFEGCTNLITITLSTNLVSLGDSVFKNCTSLSSIIIPESTESIGNNAFEGCTSLSAINLLKEKGNSTAFGTNVFLGCTSLEEINVPSNMILDYKNHTNLSLYKELLVYEDNFETYTINNNSDYEVSINTEAEKANIIRINVENDNTYKITTMCRNVSLYIYDSNMSFINDLPTYTNNNYVATLVKYLNVGTYYIRIKSVAVSTSPINISTSFCLRWTEVTYDVEYGNQTINNYIHDTREGNFETNLKYVADQGSGIYKFKMNVFHESAERLQLNESNFLVYQDANKTQIHDRYTFILNNYPALNIGATSEILIYLNESESVYLYVNFEDESLGSVSLEISKIDELEIDLFDLPENTNSDLVSYKTNSTVDDFKKITFNQAGTYMVTSTGLLGGSFIVVKENVIANGDINNNLIYSETMTANYQFTFSLDKGTYYIGYINTNVSENIMFKLTRIVTSYGNSNLMVDPYNYANSGTEVNVNDGDKEETDITEGFTRIIYLTSGESRLDYYWYSSNEEAAIVTNYGTVLGLNVDVDTYVKIMAVNKNDPSKVYVEEFLIRPEINIDEPIYYYLNIELQAETQTSINLTSIDVPYNWLQYYEWQSTSEYLIIDQFGRMYATASASGNTYEIMGEYTLNERVRIFITITVI